MDHSVENEGDRSAEAEVVETPQRTDGSDALNTAEVATSATPKQREDPSAVTDEVSRLRELQADICDQDDLERDISRQVQPKSLRYEVLSSLTLPGRQIAHGAS
jgi:DNA excision repair protein ERCC-6